MLFSQRKGYKPLKNIIQKDNIDEDLRNGLWNCFTRFYKKLYQLDSLYNEYLLKLLDSIWDSYFKKPIDTIPKISEAYNFLRTYFFECKWYEVYDFIEFILNNNDFIPSYLLIEFARSCNKVLERENSAFRIINNKYIIEITSEEEINAIENVLNLPNDYKVIRLHLEEAIKLLSNRESKDPHKYRNSIKESISAVEAICREVSGKDKATLGDALKAIAKNNVIHPALKEAFEKLYGYTNDAEGIRHALLEEPNLNYEDALYMVVTCSAFVNYLIQKSNK
ncbi:AbiJ-NTD4 domain-containing protein [Caldicellulosiruptor changbaiensis]|nr:hypothetical protein [Caldicellulosiruptor changbaiensis]